MTEDDILDGIDFNGHKKRLGEIVKKYGPALLKVAYNGAASKLPVDVTFDGSNPAVKGVLKAIASRVVGISNSTRDDLRSTIGRALQGEKDDEGRTVVPSIQEIRKRIQAQGDITSKSRAQLIARTETANAGRQGSLLAYGDANVKKVEALDTDNDEECAARNGKVFTVEEAAEIDPHPNCVLSWSPVIEK